MTDTTIRTKPELKRKLSSNKSVVAKKELQQDIKKYAETTTCHGCIYLTEGPILKRILWMLIICIMVGVACLYIYLRVSDYLEFNVSTSTQKKYDEKTPRSMYFPAVVICNYNRFFYSVQKQENDMFDLIDNYNQQFLDAGYPLDKNLVSLFHLPNMNISDLNPRTEILAQHNDTLWMDEALADSALDDFYNDKTSTSGVNVTDPISKETFLNETIKPTLLKIQAYLLAADQLTIDETGIKIEASKDMMDVLNPDVHSEIINENGQAVISATTSTTLGTGAKRFKSPSGIAEYDEKTVTFDHTDVFENKIPADRKDEISTDQDLFNNMLNLNSIDFNKPKVQNRTTKNGPAGNPRGAPPAGSTPAGSAPYDSDPGYNGYSAPGYYNDYYDEPRYGYGYGTGQDYYYYSPDDEYGHFDTITPELEQELMEKYPNLTVSEMLYRHGWNLDKQSILYTKIKGNPKNITKIWRPVLMKEGICFQLNDRVLQQNSGPGNGITVALNLMQNHYTELNPTLNREIDVANLPATVGARVYIYDPNEPFPDISNGVDIAPGFKTNIGLNKFKYLYMKKPWGLCDQITLEDAMSDYTMQGCLASCYVKKVVEVCKCIPSFALAYKEFDSYSECTLPQVWENSCRNSLARFKSTMTESTCGCYEPCTEYEYRTRMSIAKYPSEAVKDPVNFQNYFKDESFLNYIRTTSTDMNNPEDGGQAIDQNIALIDLYFEDLKYTTVTEAKADEATSLISDLGGQLGLWIGMSIMTLFEVSFCLLCMIPKIGLKKCGIIDNHDSDGKKLSWI